MQRHATSCDITRSYSTTEVADLLGVRRQTVTRWIGAGRLPAFDIGSPGRPRLRVTEAALRAYIDANQINAA